MAMTELKDVLQQQVDSARMLNSLLERERSALEGRDADLIAAVVTEKQALLTQLSQLEMDRERLISDLGTDTSPEQFDALIAQHDTTGQLASLANELRKELDTCFQMNRVNGGIAELSYHYLSHSLAILRGGEGQNETTYNPQGKTSTAGDSHRTLAKA